MCACQAHWKLGARCTCGCGDHAQLRVQQLGGTYTTTTTNAPSVTRTVLFGTDMRVSRVYEGGDSRPHIVTEGELDYMRLEPVDPGPTEAEVNEAIESIKRALPDG